MSQIAKEAFLKSVTTSMHCSEPGKDAHYDIQMLPQKGQLPKPASCSNVVWGVAVQYSRNGEPFKWATKFRNGPRCEAYAKYCEVKREREYHGYVEVAPVRNSDMRGEQLLVAQELFGALPPWDGFLVLVLQVLGYMAAHLAPARDFSLSSAVILSDLAFGAQDGLWEAIPQCIHAATFDKLAPHVTPAIREWIAAGHEGLSDWSAPTNKACGELILLCEELAVTGA